MAVIEITNLSVSFGVADSERRVALANTSLSIERGSFVCLLGPSGCGKSTLLNAVGGLVPATTGSIRVDGHAVGRPDPDRGMVFQNYTLFQWLSVQDNVEFGPKLSGMPAEKRRKHAAELIELVGLSDFRNEYPKALSGGMKQRVAIARALAVDPRVLLMDEPFGALDAQTRRRMQTLLLDVWSATGKTIVFVTHDVEEAIFLADRILVMSTRPGRIISDIPVNLPRPRSTDVVASDEFTIYRRKVLGLLEH
jgi:NitT/TauT family transport system ATP-binding protein